MIGKDRPSQLLNLKIFQITFECVTVCLWNILTFEQLTKGLWSNLEMEWQYILSRQYLIDMGVNQQILSNMEKLVGHLKS